MLRSERFLSLKNRRNLIGINSNYLFHFRSSFISQIFAFHIFIQHIFGLLNTKKIIFFTRIALHNFFMWLHDIILVQKNQYLIRKSN